jgi:hypothetical protein
MGVIVGTGFWGGFFLAVWNVERVDIEKVTPADEHTHIHQTKLAWSNTYTHPLPSPLDIPPQTPSTPTTPPSKRARECAEQLRSSPAGSVVTDGGSTVVDSPARVSGV